MKILDRVANVAIIIAVVVFLVVVGREQLAHRTAAPTTAKDFIGRTIKLPAGTQLTEGRESFVMAISTTCHFCSASLPFYKELAAKANGRLDVIAVLPQPQQEAEKYLRDASVQATKVVSARLDSLGVAATPTLLLIDAHGTVRNAWIGLLDGGSQREVLSHISPS
jgi:thiol-disulfide isomerase/thioredoxin